LIEVLLLYSSAAVAVIDYAGIGVKLSGIDV